MKGNTEEEFQMMIAQYPHESNENNILVASETKDGIKFRWRAGNEEANHRLIEDFIHFPPEEQTTYADFGTTVTPDEFDERILHAPEPKSLSPFRSSLPILDSVSKKVNLNFPPSILDVDFKKKEALIGGEGKKGPSTLSLFEVHMLTPELIPHCLARKNLT